MKWRFAVRFVRDAQQRLRGIFSLLVLLSVPVGALAQVKIIEIMYDLEGSDSGREWAEVFNSGGNAVDLVDWRFFEGDTNHKLSSVHGASVLASGGFAVIAENATQFLSDHAGFPGMLFDSSFSLSNSGELVGLRDGVLADIDTVTYASEWGATGDGNSLQESGGSWIAARPTPGAANATAPGTAPRSGSGNGSSGGSSGGSAASGAGGSSDSGSSSPSSRGGGSSGGSTSGTSTAAPKPQISAHVSGPSIVTVGALAEFRGEAIGLQGEPIENARFLWNFGDGSSGEGRALFHSWRHPGEYMVVLSVSSGEHSGLARLRVHVVAAALVMSAVEEGAEGFVEVLNEGKYDVDLSLWRFHVGERHFTLPKNTIIATGATLRFGAETTGLALTRGESVSLLYPNGSTAVRYEWPGREGTGGDNKVDVAVEPERPAATVALETSQADSQTASRPPTQSSVARVQTVASQSFSSGASAAANAAEDVDTGFKTGLAGVATLDLPPPAAGCGEGAAAGSTFFGGRIGMYLAALGGLTALGVFAFLASRRGALPAVPASEAAEYEIVEE